MDPFRILLTSSRWPLIGCLGTAWASGDQLRHENAAHDRANLRKSTIGAGMRSVNLR